MPACLHALLQVHVWRCDPHAPGINSCQAESGCPGQQQQQQQQHQQHPAMHYYGQAAWSLEQTLPYGTQIQHALALTHLPYDPAW